MQAQIIFPVPPPTIAKPEPNPVYEEFERRALKLIEKGWKRYGAKTIIEVIRHHTDLKEGPANKFKINNNNTSLYARMFAERNPKHADFFQFRRSKYDAILQ